MPPKSKIAPPESTSNAPGRLPFFKATRRVMLAAIGALALAQDEVEAYVTRLVERGELAEQDGRKIIAELLERRKIRRAQIWQESSKRIAKILENLDIPTRNDLQSLDAKITTLSQKVDSLKQD